MAGTISFSIVVPALDEASEPVDGRGRPDKVDTSGTLVTWA